MDIIEKQQCNANSPLDVSVSEDEFMKCIRKLKRGKSSGMDGISNEMLLEGGSALHTAIISIFNKILIEGIYPDSWRNNLILPIFKKGEISYPNNYRGIAISNGLGRLFSAIINSRIENFLRINHTIAVNQNGFKRGHRTDDNVFILQSIYNKYCLTKSSKLYVAFIDSRKYFDVINYGRALGPHSNFYFFVLATFYLEFSTFITRNFELKSRNFEI